MMLSREQGECCAQPGNPENNGKTNRVDGRDVSVVGLASLPLSSNDSCCSSGFGGSEVTGSDSSREVGGLGQMGTEVLASGECCVPSGCGCGPDGNSASGDPQREAPLGVNQVDGSPVDGVCCENVRNDNTGVADIETRTPERGVHRGAEKTKYGDSPYESVCGEGEQCCSNSQGENSDSHRAENSTGAGHERRHENNAGMKVER
jgi:hypothetical protein